MSTNDEISHEDLEVLRAILCNVVERRAYMRSGDYRARVDLLNRYMEVAESKAPPLKNRTWYFHTHPSGQTRPYYHVDGKLYGGCTADGSGNGFYSTVSGISGGVETLQEMGEPRVYREEKAPRAMLRPSEPQGVGAVVESTVGLRWVRVHPGGSRPWVNGYSRWAEWEEISNLDVKNYRPVKFLSYGVTE